MPDDVWSGVPDELRRLVRAYYDTKSRRYSELRALARYEAAEAALADALRDLVRDRDRLEDIVRYTEGQ